MNEPPASIGEHVHYNLISIPEAWKSYKLIQKSTSQPVCMIIAALLYALGNQIIIIFTIGSGHLTDLSEGSSSITSPISGDTTDARGSNEQEENENGNQVCMVIANFSESPCRTQHMCRWWCITTLFLFQ